MERKKKIAVLKGGQPLQHLVDNFPEQCYQRSTHVLETSLKGNSTDLRTQYALRSFQTHPLRPAVFIRQSINRSISNGNCV